MIALDARLSTSFAAGLVAAVNPCGFVLLPTYLMFFLGLSGRPGDQRATVRRALLVGGAVSAGFLAVFLVVGTVSRLFTDWLTNNAKYMSLVVGVAFVVLGIAMLFGYRLPFTTPKLDIGGRDRTVWSMFVFGIAYAIASIGCTLPLFSAVVLGTISTDGFAKGIAAIVLYGVAMGMLVTALTVTLALAQEGLLTVLRSGMRYVELVSAVVILLAGLYLTWYWYNDIRQNYDDDVTGEVIGWQESLADWMYQRRGVLAVVFGTVIATAVAFVVLRRDRSGGAPAEK